MRPRIGCEKCERLRVKMMAGLVHVRGRVRWKEILTRTLRTNILYFIDICVALYDCRTSVQFLEMRPRIGCEKCDKAERLMIAGLVRVRGEGEVEGNIDKNFKNKYTLFH